MALVRRGNDAAFETLVARYNSRLLAFCRHMLGSREDAEDILQDVMAAAYNAILADDRPINVRPWLYRIARNRSLNHLRRAQPVGMDSMDIHLHAHGMTTADKVHDREEFRLLVGDIQRLPESQRTALVLREMDALSYDQIAEAMETTIPSVKSLLVRARIGLAEASQARRLSCDEVRIELGEVAEGIQRKPSPLVRRHLKTCTRCATFQVHLKETSKSLALLLPVGPLFVLRKLILAHVGHSAGSSAGAAATSSAAGSAGAAASSAAAVGAAGGSGGLVSAGMGVLAAKTAASLAAAALVTAGAVEVDHAVQHQPTTAPTAPVVAATGGAAPSAPHHLAVVANVRAATTKAHATPKRRTAVVTTSTTATTATTTTPTDTTTTDTPTTSTTTTTSVTTVLPPSSTSSGSSSDSGTTTSEGTGTSTTSGGTTPTPTTTSTTPTSTSTTPTTTTPGSPPPSQ